jgi:hypothetical protein
VASHYELPLGFSILTYGRYEAVSPNNFAFVLGLIEVMATLGV